MKKSQLNEKRHQTVSFSYKKSLLTGKSPESVNSCSMMSQTYGIKTTQLNKN